MNSWQRLGDVRRLDRITSSASLISIWHETSHESEAERTTIRRRGRQNIECARKQMKWVLSNTCWPNECCKSKLRIHFCFRFRFLLSFFRSSVFVWFPFYFFLSLRSFDSFLRRRRVCCCWSFSFSVIACDAVVCYTPKSFLRLLNFRRAKREEIFASFLSFFQWFPSREDVSFYTCRFFLLWFHFVFLCVFLRMFFFIIIIIVFFVVAISVVVFISGLSNISVFFSWSTLCHIMNIVIWMSTECVRQPSGQKRTKTKNMIKYSLTYSELPQLHQLHYK